MFSFAVIVALLCGATGLMLFLVGSIFTAIVALGNNQKIYGWLIILLMPVSLLYCAIHWDKASYSGKMVFSGTLLLLITAVILQVGGVFSIMFNS